MASTLHSDCKKWRETEINAQTIVLNLLSIPGKVYGMDIIDILVTCVEGLLGDDQCGFKGGSGCINQILVIN